MGKSKKTKPKKRRKRSGIPTHPPTHLSQKQLPEMPLDVPSKLDKLPLTYQDVLNFFSQYIRANLSLLRKETLIRIELITQRPVISYVAKTHSIKEKEDVAIAHNDLNGFSDLISSVNTKDIDVLIVSNGGSAEATERIVALLRERYDKVRFIVPANAYSAATLMCLAGDEIIMGPSGTLGPIDPQFNGIPAREIQRAFERLEKRVKDEGAEILTAYMPQIRKYDLTILDRCETAQSLSEELARFWLSKYMLQCEQADSTVNEIIKTITNYDEQKSHARSISREKARGLGLKIRYVEEIEGLPDLVRSLYHQYEYMFDRTPYYKLYENAYGIGWGRQIPKDLFEQQEDSSDKK
jgi:ClpP class serine protease